MAAYLGLPTKVHTPSAAALHAAGVIEIFSRQALTEDAQQVKATDSALESLGGKAQAQAYSLTFAGFLDGVSHCIGCVMQLKAWCFKCEDCMRCGQVLAGIPALASHASKHQQDASTLQGGYAELPSPYTQFVWWIYLHLRPKLSKCRYNIDHTLSIWDRDNNKPI